MASQNIGYNYYMKEDKPIEFQSRGEKINTLHSYYLKMREKNTPDIDELFENDIVDKKIFDKENELVQEYKKSWEKESTPELIELKKKIDIFEGIVADQIDGGNWLGDSVEAIATHELDDVLRGVDTVLEVSLEDIDSFKEYLGLGFDLVVHKDEKRLEKKLQRFISEDIKKGKLGNLKYYKGTEISGSLDVFRLVVGTNGQTMEELIDLRLKKDWDALATHPFQVSVLLQINLQIQAALNYANKIGNENYLNRLVNVAQRMNVLVESKKDVVNMHADEVFMSKDYKNMKTFLSERLGVDI